MREGLSTVAGKHVDPDIPILEQARTALINTARGLAKSHGERLRGCNPRNVNPEKARGLSPELQAALEPLLAAVESLSERWWHYQVLYPTRNLVKRNA